MEEVFVNHSPYGVTHGAILSIEQVLKDVLWWVLTNKGVSRTNLDKIKDT